MKIIVFQYGNDLQKRAFNYSKMRSALSHIDAFFDDVYTKNDNQYIDVEDTCIIEFSVENNNQSEEILIKNIFLKISLSRKINQII